MRICYFADGRYIHAERWMQFFADRGHEMHLISFAEVPKGRAEELEAVGIKLHGTIGSLHIKKFWRTLNELRVLKRVLRVERIDILHSHFLGPNTWYSELSGFHPHVITIMGGDVIGEDWKADSSLQERIFTPRALRYADTITAWSPLLAERVRPYLRSDTRVEIVHGGVDLERFRPGPRPAQLRERLNIPEASRVVFSPRLIRPLYNIDTIAHAAGIVCERLPETFFVIALPATILDNEYVAKIKDIFAHGCARDNVRFVPTVDHREIADHFRLADVTVSIPDTDGTPMTVLESMACGTPTVIGDLPDYDREYFEHEKTTLMVDVKDARSVAAAILRFLAEPELEERITTEARRRVLETGGYEYQMKKMEAIYQRLASG